MKINLTKIITIVAVILLLTTTMYTTAETGDANPSLELNQVGDAPLLAITDFGISIDIPSEGDEVIVSGSVTNNDVVAYSNIRVVISITEDGDRPGEVGAPQEVGAQVISDLSIDQVVQFDIAVIFEAGTYSLSAVLVYNNLPIDASTSVIGLQVLSPPEGDSTTIVLGLLLIAGFLVVATFTPSFYDKFRIKRALAKRQKS
ncbi:MAG: hypothetical protein IH840_16930 [Candidatus Heimdallarchaeota archaeon]|nr:hypothetical protein [Candidatus Heimdallarchaeota archaeon]